MPALSLVFALICWMLPQPGWTFPGQTAAELIQALGPSANGYVAPPVPSADAVRAGSAQLSQIYWPQAQYDPLRSGRALQGILVTTFDYRHPTLLKRVSQADPEVGWTDLVSRSEVFLSFLAPGAFQELMTAVTKTWVITSKVRQGSEPGYDLYVLTSKDGRLTAELSYAEKGEVPPPDPSGKKPPVLNFWSKVIGP